MGTGEEVERPLATAVIGWIISSTLLTPCWFFRRSTGWSTAGTSAPRGLWRCCHRIRRGGVKPLMSRPQPSHFHEAIHEC